MPCFSPNAIVSLGDRYLPLSNHGVKNGILFCKDADYVILYDKILKKNVKIMRNDFTFVKCGQCKGCRLAESVEKANRCTLETYSHRKNYFLTLTYDDEHLPLNNKIDFETGEVTDILVPTLRREHIVGFNKSLRDYLDYHNLTFEDESPMKIMYCGELGERTGRPHYHGIYCGLNIPDLQYYKTTFNGDILYNSPMLSKIWKKGHVVIGQADWQSSAYVARYVMKKHKGQDKGIYFLNCMEPEFCQCSTHLGKEYYDKYKEDIFSEDKIIIPDKKKGFRQIAPPTTFNSWFEAESPEDFEKIKSKRQENAKRLMELEMSKTDLSIDEYLEVKRLNFEERIKALKRSSI